MKVVACVRPSEARSNARVRALGSVLGAVEASRGSPVPADTDLVIQAGHKPSTALVSAREQGIPYIVVENPVWGSRLETFSVGYNGLNGLAILPAVPEAPRPKPALKPMRPEASGPVVVIGQVHTDMALRGLDFPAWVAAKLAEYPGAEFRPHPVMLPDKGAGLEPLDSMLARAGRVVTYTSTVGAEALIAGCVSEPEHPGSFAYGVVDREAWLHRLSWSQFGLHEAEVAAAYLLTGYEEARVCAAGGLYDL